MALIAVAGIVLFFSSCKKVRADISDPIAHAESYDIWPDSIDLHNDLILRVMNDSIMELRVKGNVLDTIRCNAPQPGRMTFKSDYPLLDFLYHLEEAMPPSDKFTTSTPYEIYLNPLQTDYAQSLLQSRLVHGIVTPYQDANLEWPAVNVNAEWLLAATELAAVNGERRWRNIVEQSAKLLIANDRRMNCNPATGLFTGVPRYMAVAHGIFPPWMEAEDIAAQSTLTVNMEYCAAMHRLELPTDSLRRAIDNELWIPNMGYFSALTYGVPTCPIPLQVTDNLGQSIAIISGQVSPAMAETMVRKNPIYHSGVNLFQPQLPPASGEVRMELSATLIQTAWTIATAKVENRAAYSAAMGALFVREGERLIASRNQLPSFRSTFTTFILRGLAGMEFNDDGIFFIPNVPENLPGDKYIGNLHYRNATLSIKLSGTGSAISTFTIDGKPAEPFFDGKMSGHHEICITLAGPSADPGSITELEQPQIAPLPPVAQWSQRQATIAEGQLPANLKDNSLNNGARDMLATENPKCRLVYIDGVLQEEIYRDNYELYNSNSPTAVQFSAFYNSQLSGYSSSPYIYIPEGERVTLLASQFAKSGTKVLEDKTLASKFVESNRYKNRNITMSYNASAEGTYLVDLRYINGLGIVNSQRKLALRQLFVNSRNAGILFFPQLHSPGNIESDSWQNQTEWTNSLIVNLKKGENQLELRYYQPSPVYADPTSNMILFDLVRITPAPR